jgi:hypothetical protein
MLINLLQGEAKDLLIINIIFNKHTLNMASHGRKLGLNVSGGTNIVKGGEEKK